MRQWLVSYRAIDRDGLGADRVKVWTIHPALMVERSRRLKTPLQIECIYSAIPIPDDLLTDEQIEAMS